MIPTIAEGRATRPIVGRVALVLGLVLVGVLLAAPAGASLGGSPGAAPSSGVTAAEAADLARQAATDNRALADLRAVRSIDGRPVDLRAATAALGTDRVARLRSLATALDEHSSGLAESVRPSEARQRARDVLDQSRYRKKEAPKPFEGVLQWLGDRLEPVFGPIGRFFDSLAAVVPGGGIVVAGLVAAIAAAVVVLLVMRRSGARVATDGRVRSLLVDLGADPADLDREAAEAEAAGDMDLAVRCRYEAGILRLARAGRITVQADTTASRVATEVGGDAIAVLTATFERVVYGRVTATAGDVDEARSRWVEVVGVKGRR